MVDLEVLQRLKDDYCFDQKIPKMGMVCIIHGKIGDGSVPKLPLGSSARVTDSKSIFKCGVYQLNTLSINLNFPGAN